MVDAAVGVRVADKDSVGVSDGETVVEGVMEGVRPTVTDLVGVTVLEGDGLGDLGRHDKIVIFGACPAPPDTNEYPANTPLEELLTNEVFCQIYEEVILVPVGKKK